MGDRAPPEGLLPESVCEAVRRRANAEGDWETVRDLATRSWLATAGTTMGQRIAMYAERDPLDPVRAIPEVQRAREPAVPKGRDLAAEKGGSCQRDAQRDASRYVKNGRMGRADLIPKV